jgi:hypothetical protein
MPIKIKIRGERVHKCGSCEQALCIRHDNEDTVTYCTYMAENPLVINRAVKECSHYQEERDVSSWEMRQIAWILRTDPQRVGRMALWGKEDVRREGTLLPMKLLSLLPSKRRSLWNQLRLRSK